MATGLVAAGAIAACSASSDTGSGNAFGNSQSTNDGSGAGNTTQSGNPQGTGANSSGTFVTSTGTHTTNTGTATNTGTNTGAGGGDQCGGTAVMAEPVPLDLFIMLDQSGSMSETTSTGPTKWTSVTTALENFFTDPSSQGISVGIQFFPLLNAGIPATCSNSSQCGAFGPCGNMVCQSAFNNQSAIVFCDPNAATPCAGGSGPCVTLGQCALDDTFVCLIGGGGCGTAGNCVALANPTCANADSCTASDYGTPDVPIAMLGTSQNQALDSAISAHGPTGSTPTSAALQGAVDYAGTFAGQNPNDTVVVVLATDGIPTECSPTDAASIAAIAAAGNAATPSIKTFVIGVFSPTDDTGSAQTTLNDIAQAGSGQNAFIISTNGDVGTQFTMALDAIRANKLQCTYQVPPPQQGQMQDFGKVNVEYTPPNQSMADTINYVESMANCDPTTGGWYYNVDPANGGTPTQIIMCPETCTDFGNGGAVDIRVGCKTQIGPH